MSRKKKKSFDAAFVWHRPRKGKNCQMKQKRATRAFRPIENELKLRNQNGAAQFIAIWNGQHRDLCDIISDDTYFVDCK